MSGSRGRSTYSFRIQAEGFQEFVGDLRRLGGESEAAQRAIDTLVRSSPQLASSLDAAAQATERAARRATELREAQERLASSAQSSGQRVATLSTSFDGLERRVQSAARTTNDLRGALELIGAGGIAAGLGPLAGAANTLGDALSVAGLASGRLEGALGALTPRLASLAGLVGLPIFLQSVGLGINDAGIAAGSASGTMDQWHATLLRLNPTLEQTASLANAAADAVRKANLATLEGSFGANLERRAAAIARLPQIDAQLAGAERAAAEAEARAVTLGLQQSQADLGNPFLRNRALVGAGAAASAEQASAAARERVTALRNERLQYEDEVRRLSQTADEFQNARAMIQGAIYGEAAGPPGPPGSPGAAAGRPGARAGAGAGSRDAAALDRDFDRAEQLARRTVQSAIDADARAQATISRAREREEATRERAAERTTDSITRYLADGFTDTLRGMEGGFAATMRTLQQTALNTVIRIGAEAVIRPVASGAVNALGLGGGSASEIMSGLGQLTGLSGLLPSGGFGGMASSLLPSLFTSTGSANVASAASLAATTPEALLAAMPAGPSSAMGVSLGGVLGGVGAGFGAGMLTNTILGGNQTGGMVGSGLGAAAGVGLSLALGPAAPLGLLASGLLGGVLGGAGGGLFGPGEKTNAFGFGVNATGGRFALDNMRATGTGGDGAAIYQQTQQQLAQINAALDAVGLNVVDNNRVIAGGAPISEGQFSDLGGALTAFRFTGGNANVSRALGARPDAGFDEAVGISQFVTGVYAALSDASEPASDFAQAFKAITDSFGPVIAQAESLTLATDGLVASQQQQLDALLKQREDQTRSIVSGVAAQYYRAIGQDSTAQLIEFDAAKPVALQALEDNLRRLGNTSEGVAAQVALLETTQGIQRENIIRDAERMAQAERERAAAADQAAQRARVDASRGLYEQLAFGDLGGLSPEARRQAAGLALNNARGALLDGATTDEIAEFSRVAQATLPVIRDFEGISPAFAGVVQLVNDTLRDFSPEGDSGGLAALIDLQVDSNSELVSAVRQGNSDIASQIQNLADQIRAIVTKKV